MSITSLQSVPTPRTPSDATATTAAAAAPSCPAQAAPAGAWADVPTLRRIRREAAAELSHCDHLVRLVRARVDLLVGGALSPLHPLTAPSSDTSAGASTVDDVTRLALHLPVAGVAEHLFALAETGRRLAVQREVLQERFDDVTDALVRALEADPAAALVAVPRC